MAAPDYRRTADTTGREGQGRWSPVTEGNRDAGDTGYAVGLVSHAHRAQVRWVEVTSLSHPRINRDIEQLVVRMAKENTDWGYDRIVGALANLGYTLSDQTVGNILRRHGIPPAPERKRNTTWAEFIRAHLSVLAATDFFTVEVLTLRGLVTYYVLFFMLLDSRRVEIAGITPHPHEAFWMQQIAWNITMDEWGFLEGRRYLIHDRDTKYTDAFRRIIQSSDVEPELSGRKKPSNDTFGRSKISAENRAAGAGPAGRDWLGSKRPGLKAWHSSL